MKAVEGGATAYEAPFIESMNSLVLCKAGAATATAPMMETGSGITGGGEKIQVVLIPHFWVNKGIVSEH